MEEDIGRTMRRAVSLRFQNALRVGLFWLDPVDVAAYGVTNFAGGALAVCIGPQLQLTSRIQVFEHGYDDETLFDRACSELGRLHRSVRECTGSAEGELAVVPEHFYLVIIYLVSSETPAP